MRPVIHSVTLDIFSCVTFAQTCTLYFFVPYKKTAFCVTITCTITHVKQILTHVDKFNVGKSRVSIPNLAYVTFTTVILSVPRAALVDRFHGSSEDTESEFSQGLLQVVRAFDMDL